MAATEEGAALTEQHRGRQLEIRAGAVAELGNLWRLVELTDLPGTIGPFVQAVVPLLAAAHQESAREAASYYRLYREAERVPGLAPVLQLLPPPVTDMVVGTARGAALAGIVNARRRGADPQRAMDNGLVKVAGAAGRLILSGGRQQLLAIAARDVRAGRWRRVAGSGACDWCVMLADRGAVFRADTARFDAHDHCACGAEVQFER